MSSNLKPGNSVWGTEGRALEGVYIKERAAWLEPRESAKDTERGERDRRVEATLLTKMRSIINSFWSWQPLSCRDGRIVEEIQAIIFEPILKGRGPRER
jgi:hypothetical protein